MTRRIRLGKEYFYARFPGAPEKYLGSDFGAAVTAWHEHWKTIGAYIPNAFENIADRFQREYLPGLARKTQKEYELGIVRLKKVFGSAALESITKGSIAKLRDTLKDTPFQANRLIALLSSLWNWAREHEITSAPNPCADVHRHKEHRRKTIVTPAMFYAVYDAGDQVLKDWMRLDWMIADRVNDILRLQVRHIKTEKGIRWLHSHATKTDTDGRIRIDGDLETLLDELVKRPRNATGPYLIQTDNGQRVTQAMLRNRFDEARAKAKEAAGDAWIDWQMRDIRKASLNEAETLEEARRRGKHADSRTTARHYELVMNATAAALPQRESTDNSGQIAPNSAETGS